METQPGSVRPASPPAHEPGSLRWPAALEYVGSWCFLLILSFLGYENLFEQTRSGDDEHDRGAEFVGLTSLNPI